MAAGFGNLLPPVVAVLQANITDFSSKMAAARGEMEVVAKTGGGHIDRIAAFGKKALAATAIASVAVLGVSAKAAIDFEDSFAGIRKTVDATEADFKKLEGGMRDLAKQIPINVNELNRIGEAAGALGIQNDSILAFTETVAKMGVTTNLSSDMAATAFGKLANVLDLAEADFSRLGSTIVGLGNKGASTESEITDLMLRIAGTARFVGFATADIAGFAAAVANAGIDAERGGTAITRTLREIAIAVSDGGPQLEKFARVAGTSAADFARAFKGDPAVATAQFIGGLQRMHGEGKSVIGVLHDLGITETRQFETLALLAQAQTSVTDSLQMARPLWQQNNALQIEAEKRFETTKSQIILLGNHLIDIGITIGQKVLPPAIAFTKWLIEHKEVAIAAAAVIGGALAFAIGTYLYTAIGNAVSAGATLTGHIVKLIAHSQAWTVANGGLVASLRTVALSAGPLVGILAAVGVAVVGVGWMMRDASKRADEWAQSFVKAGRSAEENLAAIRAEMRKLKAEQDSFGERFLAQFSSLKGLKEALLPGTTDSAAKRFAAALEQEKLLVDQVKAQREAAEGLGSALDGSAQQWSEHGAAGTTALDDIAASADEAKKAVSEYVKGVETALSPTLDAKDAAIRFAETIDKLSDQVRKNGRAFGLKTEKERENFRVINDLIGQVPRYVEGQAELGRVAGDVASQHAEQVRIYKDLQQQFPFLKDEIQGYIAKLDAIPRNIHTELEVEATLRGNKAAIRAIESSGGSLGLVVGPKPRAVGGFIEHPEIALIGERGRELVLPLYDQARTQQLLAQAGLAGMARSASVPVIPGGTSNVSTVILNIGDINVTESRDGRGSARGVRDELIRASRRIGKLWPEN